jgi:glycolate oxidase
MRVTGSAARDRAKIAFEEILTDALDLGGTVTGEHGVGLLKRGGLSRELPRGPRDASRGESRA